MRLVGVDGCPAGWVVAECQLADAAEDVGRRPLAEPEFRIRRTFEGLLASLAGERAVIAVDIPIGLPGGWPHDDGSRLADRAARAFLGGQRGSSVFSAPCRPTLNAADYAAACASELTARGKKLSKQAFGILPKIREVDRVVTPGHQLPLAQSDGAIVREVHPEVAFALLRGGGEAGRGLVTSKRTPAGEAERLVLLRPHFSDLELGRGRAELIAAYRAETSAGTRARRNVVSRDDLVDALACLIVAGRIATGQARTFPSGEPQVDARGLRMEIVG